MTMRASRLTFLALLLAFGFTACTSPTASDDDCTVTDSCFGHPDSGS
jgi:hypothetical protein